ncbi:MAG: YraN family protein [Planctomycetota bacterium]
MNLLLLPFTRRRLLADRKLLGRWGEKQSEKFLKRKGFKIIARNFACKMGEIDLIGSENNGAVVFVEVRTRADESYTEVQETVTPKKQGRLIRTAKYFLKIYEVKDRPLRFDVVAVVLGHKGRPQIRHYENAFKP